MVTVYLPPREGHHDFAEDFQVPEGTITKIVAPFGYRYNHICGGVWLYRTWWCRAFGKVMDLLGA
ncbi:hypothetical protein CN130_11010 [Sinorhizobium meliloti]|uniref:hypothetical protein n=1 Tax=Rhizobium meliloti TaxID=382 RepID=UPI000FD9675E|nr:hypothetical protein [Sinorhizobium meliloti]RVM34246.1 hypothetical protein CN130_11010 [Sinorhizobium meliloti]